MLSKDEFIKKLGMLPPVIPSKTGNASYTSFQINGDTLTFVRVNPKTKWELSISSLYGVYKKQNFINTIVVKQVTGGRVNSPSVAILMAIGCIDKKGNRI